MRTGNASDISSGCQLKIPDVSVAFVPVLTAVNARPPRSLNTHTVTRINVVNSQPRVNQVNHLGGGGPRKVFATPPSSYSSIAISVGATRREATRCSAPLDRSIGACTAVPRPAECCLARILWDSCDTSAVIAAGRFAGSGSAEPCVKRSCQHLQVGVTVPVILLLLVLSSTKTSGAVHSSHCLLQVLVNLSLQCDC